MDSHATSKLAEAVSPATTVTVCGFAPVTAQLDVRLINSTSWSPGASPVIVTTAFTPIDCLLPNTLAR